MTQNLTRQLNETEQAFAAVVSVGRERADMIEQAQREGDIAAESLAIVFGIAALHEAIDANPKAKEIIGRAAGHKWGFSTDQNKPNGGGSTYDISVVIPCFCEALLQKLKPVGNEFNIIKGSTYVTKEGWTGKIMRLPGVTEVDIAPGVIRPEDCTELKFTTKSGTRNDGTTWGGVEKTEFSVYASARASCRVWGHLVEVTAGVGTNGIDERLQVAADGETMSDVIDQLRGKAIARIAHRLFQKCVNLSMAGPQSEQAPRVKYVASGELKPRRIDVPETIVSRDTNTIMDQPTQKTKPKEPKQKDEVPIVTYSKDEYAAELGTLKQRGELAAEALASDVESQMGFTTVWDRITGVKNATALKAIGEDIKATGDRFGDSLTVMRDWYSFRMKEITGKIVVAK